MDRRLRARLALEILKAYDRAEPYVRLTGDQLTDVAANLVASARKAMLQDAAGMIDKLCKLGFSNKEISDGIHFDAGTTSRAHSGGSDLQLGLLKLRSLVTELRTFTERAKIERLNLILACNEPQLMPLDYCASLAVSDETSSQATTAVLKNLTCCLTDGVQQRLALPEGLHGVLVQLGPPTFGVFVIQIEGASDVDRLETQIHELRHLVERKEAELARRKGEVLDTSPQRQNRPRSAF